MELVRQDCVVSLFSAGHSELHVFGCAEMLAISVAVLITNSHPKLVALMIFSAAELQRFFSRSSRERKERGREREREIFLEILLAVYGRCHLMIIRDVANDPTWQGCLWSLGSWEHVFSESPFPKTTQ